MMHYLYDLFAQIVFWFIRGVFDNNHIPDATTSPEQDSDPSPGHHTRSATSNPHDINEENGELNHQRNECVQPGEDKTKNSRSEETSRNETDNKEGNYSSSTAKRNKAEEFQYANIDNSNNNNGDIDAFDNVREVSYTTYFAECDETMKNNRTTFSTDDGESIQGYDSILESTPLYEPEGEPMGFEIAHFPDLEGTDPSSVLDFSVTEDPMSGLCAYCFRRMGQHDDKFDRKDGESRRRSICSKTGFFRRRKDFWAQCSACGFGMAKKGVRGRSIHKVKNILRKITGRE